MSYHNQPRPGGRREIRIFCRSYHPGGYILEKHVHTAVLRSITEIQEIDDLDELMDERPDLDATQRQLADVEKQVATLNTQTERADTAYVSGTMTEARHKTQVRKITEQLRKVEERRTTLLKRRDKDLHSADRLTRLEEIRDRGTSVLEEADIPAANAWLRKHFRIYILDGAVFDITYP